MLRPSSLALLAIAPLALFPLVAGCSAEDDEKGGATHLGAPSLSLRSVAGVPVPEESPGKIEVALACDGLLPVSLAVENWALRPPGACFGHSQCGQIGLLVDPPAAAEDDAETSLDAALTQTSATTFVALDLSDLASPSGEHLLRAVLLHDGSRSVVVDGAGEELAREVEIVVEIPADCDEAPGDGDAGIEDDAASEEDAGDDAAPVEAGPDAADEEGGAGEL